MRARRLNVFIVRFSFRDALCAGSALHDRFNAAPDDVSILACVIGTTGVFAPLVMSILVDDRSPCDLPANDPV
jgi:hypothetical protein